MSTESRHHPTPAERTRLETDCGLDLHSAPGPACTMYRLVRRHRTTGPEATRPGAVILDRHSPRILAAILSIILLSVLDAALTLFLVSCGAREMNPLMAYFLNRGPLYFFWAKYLLTCMPLLFILVHKRVCLFGTRMKAEELLLWIALPFALVVNWELYLILCVI